MPGETVLSVSEDKTSHEDSHKQPQDVDNFHFNNGLEVLEVTGNGKQEEDGVLDKGVEVGLRESRRQSEAPDEQEMELDMWEGQFSLTNSHHSAAEDEGQLDLEGSISTDHLDPLGAAGRTVGFGLARSTGRWKSDSSVSCYTVQQLQEQVGVLAENQANNDDRYSRVKQDNAALTARIHILEEHIRELEVRSEEKLLEEQRRSRELQARLEREKQLELENFTIRYNGLEQETGRLKDENGQLKKEVERLREEKNKVEDQLIEAQREVGRERESRRETEEERRGERETWERENLQTSHVIHELNKELEELREAKSLMVGNNSLGGSHLASMVEMDHLDSTDSNRLSELESEAKQLKEANKRLEEANEELQAQMLNKSLNEGRQLLTSQALNNSLAAEFEAMSENETGADLVTEIEKIRKALRDQQDENQQLRNYIDNVLLSIMDKYPELLEIRASK